MNRADAIATMNEWGGKNIPFVFIVDFDARESLVVRTDEACAAGVLFDFRGRTNTDTQVPTSRRFDLAPVPVPFSTYRRAFDEIQNHLAAGHTYLANLTFPTAVSLSASLEEVFHASRAAYRLLVRDRFVVFSPESFIRVHDSRITTYPMKGTIDAAVPNAERVILSNEKESAEHVTIVDLLRNDIGMVASNVRVDRFRYVERVETHAGGLLQVSSQIGGDLADGFESRIGDLLFTMLPAGSVTGAPKKRTVEILKSVEGYERGFFTGVAGIFDGRGLDSCVLIRYIEQKEKRYYYKSGGGITAMSDPEEEYAELLRKVYVPSV